MSVESTQSNNQHETETVNRLSEEERRHLAHPTLQEVREDKTLFLCGD